MRGLSGRSWRSTWRLLFGVVGFVLAVVGPVSAASAAGVRPNRIGSLDCNHLSTIQQSVKIFLACTDLHNPTQSDNRFSDNGTYIGHDEPDLNFTSSVPGSGNDTTWTFTLGKDPAALPTNSQPGKDVSHYVELTPAVWFSMNLCDPLSYPLNPCTPKSDANAPAAECLAVAPCHGFLGGGSAFMELQFYPPGFGPWAVAPSFDNTHWGAALTVDSLEAKPGFADINPGCTEPVNFAFLQRNGVPEGPPSPQLSTLASSTPNSETLLMNPGDTIRVHMFDAPAPGGGHALEADVADLSTGQSGFMQASAANGFMDTNVTTCEGTPFNFEPEYSTASAGNVSPWGAGTEAISAAFELGHFEPCTSLGDPGLLPLGGDVFDTYFNHCVGPYEQTAEGGDGKDTVEPSDALCFPAGDEHGGLAAGFPDLLTGCQDALTQNGDLDFDGSSYWSEWPNSTTPNTYPASFQMKPPTTVGDREYSAFQLQTDLPFSEVTTCSPETPSGCTAPPPNAPGKFYPYWTLVSSATSTGAVCSWEFGNMTNGNTFGASAQYGSFNTTAPVEAPDLASQFFTNPCTA
jgi:hypothetical protein